MLATPVSAGISQILLVRISIPQFLRGDFFDSIGNGRTADHHYRTHRPVEAIPFGLNRVHAKREAKSSFNRVIFQS